MLRYARFSSPRPFTNALLHNREITALIRDVEPHERGLFSTDSSIGGEIGQLKSRSIGPDFRARKQTGYNGTQNQASAVARVLGRDMLKKIQSSNRHGNRERGVDVEVLLVGAERLCEAFDVPGALDKIAILRQRHYEVSTSIKRYETQVSQQQAAISKYNGGEQRYSEDAENTISVADMQKSITEADLRAEEEAVRELDAKKKALEARVANIGKDLGGIRP